MSGRGVLLAVAVAVALYAPTISYDFVQDDRAIIALNPAAHSLGAALCAVDDPYWPPPSEAGLWRPLTILSFAVDWTLADGHPGWLHLANALWHGLVTALVFGVLARWLPERAAAAAALVFAVHPVHVEAVAGLVGRSELLPAAALLGGVLAVRGRRWGLALALAMAAMLTKESGVVVSVVILLYCWLDREIGDPPRWFIGAVAVATAGYLVAWRSVGGVAVADVAAPFIGATTGERLAIALPAVWRAAILLGWPADLSADYGPQVLPVPRGLTVAALGGVAVVGLAVTLAWRYRRLAPQLAWAMCAAALAYLPTSNLLFPSGVVLAERNLYVAVLVPAVLVGMAVERARILAGRYAALALTMLIVGPMVVRTGTRVPAWADNRTFLITLLAEHPESARGHFWAAGVLGRMGDTAAARASYDRAIGLYDRDPHVLGSAAIFYLDLGDTTAAGVLARRGGGILPREPRSLRVSYLLALAAGDSARAAALADSIDAWFPGARGTYLIRQQ